MLVSSIGNVIIGSFALLLVVPLALEDSLSSLFSFRLVDDEEVCDDDKNDESLKGPPSTAVFAT